MLLRNADVAHCEKTVFYFQNKGVYRADDFNMIKEFLISVFSDVT